MQMSDELDRPLAGSTPMIEASVAEAALTARAKRLARELEMEQALNAGLLAQARALKHALRIVNPEHVLLRRTGRTFSDTGAPETNLSLVFNHAFDIAARELGMRQPEKARASAR
jgi:hypothetical protein